MISQRKLPPSRAAAGRRLGSVLSGQVCEIYVSHIDVSWVQCYKTISPRRNFRSFRVGWQFKSGLREPDEAAEAGELIYRAIVERHFGKHTGLRHSAKACPRGHAGCGNRPSRLAVVRPETNQRAAGPRQSGRDHGGFCGQNSAGARAAGSKAMSMKFDIQPAANPTSEKDRAAKLVDPGFGRVFTDHMAIVRYNARRRAGMTRASSRAPISRSIRRCAVLHYAQEIFEGLKAYKRDDGGVNLFRPDANARRFKDSAERMAMAQLPEDVFIEAVEQLVRIDRAWIPGGEGSLYLRPFMIASEIFLGVKPSSEYIFAVIASPVGSYFKGGPAPVSIWVSENYTRAALGGTGAVKCGGNYAASLRAQAEAIEHGCDQVVFLDAVERRCVEELGGMNVFFVFDDGSLLTPPLGTILPGITRDSIIALAKDAGKHACARSRTRSTSGAPMPPAAS